MCTERCVIGLKYRCGVAWRFTLTKPIEVSIYWLFGLGKEKTFECLIYLHRYNEGTLTRMRTESFTPLLGKYEAHQLLLSEQVIKALGKKLRTIEKDPKALTKKIRTTHLQ